MLLGALPPGRNTEQHDHFFGIATNLKELIPAIKAFWPDAGSQLHIDGWREVNLVDGHQIRVALRDEHSIPSAKKLFFINLGGYQHGELEEQHYTVLTVKDDRTEAIQDAKRTIFFKTNTIKGAGSHIDEKYGIDVDDIYKIEDILAPELKSKYHIQITPATDMPDDEIHLGYFRLDKIK